MPCTQGVDEQGGLTVTCVSNYASPGRTSAENKREVFRPWRQPTIISLCIARVFVLRVVQRTSSYHVTSKNIRECTELSRGHQQSHFFFSIRSVIDFPFSPPFFSLSLSFFWFRRSINQRIRGGNERISGRRTPRWRWRRVIEYA